MNSAAVDINTLEAQSDLIVIEGKGPDDRRFRPSDWSERLASNFACFGTDHRLRYSPKVYPVLIDGIPCLIVAKDLERSDPAGYAFVMQFATENNLCVHEDRRQTPRGQEPDRRKEKAGVRT